MVNEIRRALDEFWPDVRGSTEAFLGSCKRHPGKRAHAHTTQLVDLWPPQFEQRFLS